MTRPAIEACIKVFIFVLVITFALTVFRVLGMLGVI